MSDGCPRCGNRTFRWGKCTGCGYAGWARFDPLPPPDIGIRPVLKRPERVVWQDWVCLGCGRTTSHPMGSTQASCGVCGHPDTYCIGAISISPPADPGFDAWQCMACGNLVAVASGHQPGRCAACDTPGRFGKIQPPEGHPMDVKFTNHLPAGWYVTNPDTRTAVINNRYNVEVARVGYTLPVIGSTEACVHIGMTKEADQAKGERHGLMLRHTIPAGFDGTLAPWGVRIFNASREGLVIDLNEGGKVMHIHDAPNLRRQTEASKSTMEIKVDASQVKAAIEEGLQAIRDEAVIGPPDVNYSVVVPEGYVARASDTGSGVAIYGERGGWAGMVHAFRGHGETVEVIAHLNHLPRIEPMVDKAQDHLRRLAERHASAGPAEPMAELVSSLAPRMTYGELALMIGGALRRAHGARSAITIPDLLGIVIDGTDTFEDVFKRYAEAADKLGE